MCKDNVVKISSMLDLILAKDFNPASDVPFAWMELPVPEDAPKICTSGISKKDQATLHHMRPLFDTFMDMKLGYQNDLMIYGMFLIFEGEGACAFYQDPEEGR